MGKYAAGAATAGTLSGWRGGMRVGLGGYGYGRRTESVLRQEAWQEARFAQPLPWSSRGRRGVQIARRARPHARLHHHWTTRADGGTPLRARTVARPGDGTPAQYRAPGAQARSLDN